MIKNKINALKDKTIKKYMWSKKKERQIRKKDKEVQRERWKEIEKEMEGKRLTSRKN